MIPPRRILAAVDFSNSARAALTFAGRLAVQLGAELDVLYAEDPRLSAAAAAAGVCLERDACGELERFVHATAGIPAHYSLHVVVGPPTDVICDIACREHADLIVLGVHGLSPSSRAVFGSTTEGVLRHATVSMVMVPQDWHSSRPSQPGLMGIGPVVAGIDGGEPSLFAAAAGARLADRLGTSLELVHVVQDLPVPCPWQSYAHAAATAEREAAERDLPPLVHGLHLSREPKVEMLAGNIAERLVVKAARAPTREPILVMGRRCAGHRDSAPGATATRVLAMTHVPVLVHLYGEPD